ncbi:hypothetical protein QTP86_028269, partial [Hemibagrus guttatus]
SPPLDTDNTQADLAEAEREVGVAPGPGEGEKALIREEFERGLQEQGLEIEQDVEMKTVRFTRLHVPWSVLSREAELLKIKVPTKRGETWTGEVFSIQGMVLVIPVRKSSISQRERERTHTHCVAAPQIYELKEKTGLSGVLSALGEKMNQPFHPGSPRDTKEPTHTSPVTAVQQGETTPVFEILRRTACTQSCQTMGIASLLAKGVYDAAFPLHDGDFNSDIKELRNDRQLLHDEWANYGVFFKYQPVDLISQEMCDKRLNFTMCPLCDEVCDYWQLSSMCSTARASYLFDNHATVAFAIFMSLWGAVFLEHWKRRQRCLQHSWDLTGIEDEEDELRPAYEDFLLQKRQKKSKNKMKEETDDGTHDVGREQLLSAKGGQPLFASESLTWRDRLPGYCINMSSILLMVVVTLAAVSGVILYRIIVFAVMSMTPDHEAKANVRVTVTTTAVIINLLVVLVLDEIYGAVAAWITELEIPKTEAAFEEHLILKTFLLKSMNAFAPVFYVAFFKGRLAGRPGDYVYVFKDFRMEECAPAGCLIEVCIQLGMIMLGKQLIQNNVFEIAIPKLKKMYRKYKEEKEGGEKKKKDRDPNRPRHRWDLDYQLEPYEGLSPEYMEMIIQYGFVTLFVASFPLAPVFALLNNVIEIRLDAAKFVTEIRRPDAVRAKEIDLEKAYDRVPREELWYCMRKSGVAEKYVRVVQDMYERSRTVVRCAVGQTEEFNVEVGLHQGSALSPFLFAIVMDQLSEEIRQESPWTMMFADDIVICSESREQVEENLERWRFALERRGMKVSGSKTEYMCVNEREGSGTVRLQGEEVKKVQEFKYLGSTVQSNGECGKEVKKRVQAGWNGWRKVWGVLCERKISARIKGKVYRTVVRAAMLYGLETVSLRKRQESELEVAELKMLRFSLGVTRLDRIRNEYIRGTAHVGRLGDKDREDRLRWFGHVQRRERIWYNILSGISKFAVITNAFVISFTSEFIPRMVYQYLYSETGTMHGFIDHTLAYFNTSNFKPGTAPNSTRFDRELRICRYKDYRDPPWSPESYQLSKQYWSVLAARLAFVIFFQNLAMFLSMLVAWLIPDVPRSLKDCLKREKALLLDLLLSEEVQKQRRQSKRPAKINIINNSEEETVEIEPDCSIMLQSQTNENELQTADKDNLPREEPESTTSEPISPTKDCQSLTTSDPDLNRPVPQSPVKPVGTSHFQEFNLNGPPPRDPGSRSRSRCQTLPPRHRGDQPGDSSGKTSHSTSFVHFNQNVPQTTSELLQDMPTVLLPPQDKRHSSKTSPITELFSRQFSVLSCHPFKTELQTEAQPCPQSKPEITSSQKALAQSPSKPELSVSPSTALPRPPSRPELSVSQSAVLPRPPSKPELMGNIAKGLPLQDPAIRTKSRCQTLPPRHRGPDTLESSLRTTHSTSFTNFNKKLSPLPSDVTHNTSV